MVEPRGGVRPEGAGAQREAILESWSRALADAGDTLEMMRAVLDTNPWLATHVTTVTLGYSATYLAGLGFVRDYPAMTYYAAWSSSGV